MIIAMAPTRDSIRAAKASNGSDRDIYNAAEAPACSATDPCYAVKASTSAEMAPELLR